MKKPIAIAILALLAISLAFIPAVSADTTLKSTWIRMGGTITRWGETRSSDGLELMLE